MYQREHFFRLVKNGLEVVFNLISENQNAETLQFDLSKCERIKIEYTSPSFVGVKTLTTQKYGGNYYEIVGENKIKIVLSNLHNAPYLLNGVAFYGSYTLSICSLQIDVPSNVPKGIQDLGEISQVVVKSFEIGGGGGGGFTPTETQLQAINSGATTEKITQIATNTNALKYTPKATGMISPTTPEGFAWDGFIWIEGEVPPNEIPCACKIFNATTETWENGTYEGRAFDTFWWAQGENIQRNVSVINFDGYGLIFMSDPAEESLWAMKQDLINDEDQASNPTDTDSLSDLNGTTNKRWTFLMIWNYIKGKITSVYYPVGSVVLNMGTNPATNFGGTWELLADGTKALYLDSTAGTTINEELPNLKLEVNDIYLKGDRRTPKTTPGTTLSLNNNDWGGTNSGGATNLQSLKFNANGYNPVYKDDGKVRPAGITICAWKRTA